MHKIEEIDELFPQILMIKKSYNKIGQEHFCPKNWETEFFHTWGLQKKKKRTAMPFILGYFQQKVMIQDKKN